MKILALLTGTRSSTKGAVPGARPTGSTPTGWPLGRLTPTGI